MGGEGGGAGGGGGGGGGGEFSEGQEVRTKFLEGARFSRTNLCCFRFSYISIYLIENGAMYKNI